jgi:DNA repair ATPase RecN
MKTILDKINKADEIQANKVELAKHEVELGAIDDLQSKYKTIASKAPKIKEVLLNKTTELRTVVKELNDLQSDAQKLVEMAKFLGADSVQQTASQLFKVTGDLASSFGSAAISIEQSVKKI